MRRTSILVLLCATLLLAVLQVGHAAAQMPESDMVIVANLQGVLNPMSERYLERVLKLAVQADAAAVVLVLDTPGGPEGTMRAMVQSLLDAPLPVLVYVAPDGARASSAGMFVLLAAHVASMAPGTHVGAAHPVALGVQANELAMAKITRDAEALAQSIASVRGRNLEWPALAVRSSVSLIAAEARQAGVIDLVSPSVDALLAAVDGRSVTVGGRVVTLHTADAQERLVPMRWDEQLIHSITHPDIAYLLLTVGTLLLLVELAEPGLGVGGGGAAVAFILAFIALGSLPLNWAGAALLLVAATMLVVALLSDANPVVTGSAIIPFVLGSLILYNPPGQLGQPLVHVSPWLIGTMAVLLGGVVFLVLRAVLRATTLPPQSGAERLVGMAGVALSALDPEGAVRVGSARWSARVPGRPVAAGTKVRVVAVEGIHLVVVEDTHSGG